MITYIKINGFKSLVNFEMEFSPFTVIAGLNASGKSNLFDAFKLLSSLATSDNIKKAFGEQRGELSELFTQYSETDYADEMNFEVEMLVNKTVSDAWGNTADIRYTRLQYVLKISRLLSVTDIQNLIVTYEHLEIINPNEDNWALQAIPSKYAEMWIPSIQKSKRKIPFIKTTEENGIPTVTVLEDDSSKRNRRRFPLINATRTVLSSFDTVDFPHVLAVKEELKQWKFLQLNPEDLRRPTQKEYGSDVISESGKNLAGAFYRLKQDDSFITSEVSDRLQKFIPSFIKADVIDDKENKQYLIKLKDIDKKEYTSRVLSEGTLRILALCIMEADTKHNGLLCFEEPENGIHPHRIQAMAELLFDLTTNFIDIEYPLRQVIVNTHSPVFINSLNNKIYRPSVKILYSQQRKRIMTYNGKRHSIGVTSIIPVSKNPQSKIQFTDAEHKFTIKTIEDFLNHPELIEQL